MTELDRIGQTCAEYDRIRQNIAEFCRIGQNCSRPSYVHECKFEWRLATFSQHASRANTLLHKVGNHGGYVQPRNATSSTLRRSDVKLRLVNNRHAWIELCNHRRNMSRLDRLGQAQTELGRWCKPYAMLNNHTAFAPGKLATTPGDAKHTFGKYEHVAENPTVRDGNVCICKPMCNVGVGFAHTTWHFATLRTRHACVARKGGIGHYMRELCRIIRWTD